MDRNSIGRSHTRLKRDDFPFEVDVFHLFVDSSYPDSLMPFFGRVTYGMIIFFYFFIIIIIIVLLYFCFILFVVVFFYCFYFILSSSRSFCYKPNVTGYIECLADTLRSRTDGFFGAAVWLGAGCWGWGWFARRSVLSVPVSCLSGYLPIRRDRSVRE